MQFCHKIGCHGNVPEKLKKRGPDKSSAPRALPYDEKVAKIGQ